MASLSLCMIVRDEQEMLPDFLASVAGIWDELVVVDTGSRDDTVAMVEAAGARVIRHAWRDDFSAARNCSLEAATGDWICFLDADERVTPQLAAEIRRLLDDDRAGAATVVMRNRRPDGTWRDADLLRLFRNDPGIRFRHRIHEDPSEGVRAFLARTGLETRRLGGIVEHLGYLKAVAASRGKRARDADLLRRELKRNPDDLYSWFKLMEQARYWDDRRAWRKAARGCSRRFDKAPRADLADRPWADELCALLAQGLHDHPRQGLRWLEVLPPRLQEGPAVLLRRAMWLEESGETEAAAAAYAACIEASGRRNDDTLFALRAGMGLCRLKAAGGDLPGAWEQAVAACAACPEDREALLAAVGFAPSDLARADWLASHLAAHPEAVGAVAETLAACGLTGLAENLAAAVPR